MVPHQALLSEATRQAGIVDIAALFTLLFPLFLFLLFGGFLWRFLGLSLRFM